MKIYFVSLEYRGNETVSPELTKEQKRILMKLRKQINRKIKELPYLQQNNSLIIPKVLLPSLEEIIEEINSTYEKDITRFMNSFKEMGKQSPYSKKDLTLRIEEKTMHKLQKYGEDPFDTGCHKAINGYLLKEIIKMLKTIKNLIEKNEIKKHIPIHKAKKLSKCKEIIQLLNNLESSSLCKI
jgi:uncharacterized protein YeeX (DUF496 family)